MQDIHNYKRTLERLIERIENEEKFSPEDRKIALSFKDDLLANNLSLPKVARYLQHMIWFNRTFKKNFSDANIQDIKEIVAGLNQSDYSENTKKSIKIGLRKLYKFIRGVEGKGKYPPEVAWYTVTISNSKKKMPEELLTEDEMLRIIKLCTCERDRALIAVLCESGCRVGEIGTMKIKHISLEEHGARLTVDGKTGMRKILVVSSAPYLQTWLNHHPNNENPDEFLWINYRGSLLSYARISNILKQSAEKARIKKRVYPHLLRHSRATIMAKCMTDATMKHYFGWAQGSNMASVYIHMSGKDTDDAVLLANGIEVKKETRASRLIPTTCLKCGVKNEMTNKFCKSCGIPLSSEEAEKIIKEDEEKNKTDELMNEFVKNPDFLRMLVKKMAEMNIG
ncbi:tyrosine-type recombinase/integrase [Candidatus Pacearchaeota archaeon]|nr:tyrosine-type recombinase/integrase [Candidatus Pacearchaeota archaeon]